MDQGDVLVDSRGRRPRRPVVRICVKSDSRDVEDDVPYSVENT